jgi:pimeloyl-ACP methyl ester carboxylesterase
LIETYNGTATFTKHLAQTRRTRFGDGVSIRVPVTIAWGDDERLIPAKARRRDELPPQTKTLTLCGCGHVPFWGRPRAGRPHNPRYHIWRGYAERLCSLNR